MVDTLPFESLLVIRLLCLLCLLYLALDELKVFSYCPVFGLLE